MATLDLGKVVPEKGVDYFTNADKEEIKTLTAQQVEEDLDFTETVDTINQNITDLQNTKIDKNVDDLTYYYKSSETYTKTEIDGKVSSVYKYKGSVATYQDLPSQNNVIGDTYNVEEDGSNYSWNGTTWDKLGGDIDLSDYYTKSQADTLLNGKQNVINSSNKLSADNIDDTLSTQKMTNINEKNAWNAKYDKPNAGIPKNDLASAVQASLDLADTAEQPTNKVTSIDENSTDTEYPSAKAVYDIEQAQNTLIDLVRNFVNNYYDIENALPTVTQTSAEDIVLNDTMNNAPLKLSLASSESTQKTTLGKNLSPNNATTQTINGIAFTKNEDGTVVANGTATDDTSITIASLTFQYGDYVLSGCPSGGDISTYSMVLSATARDTGDGKIFHEASNKALLIEIKNGTVCNNLVFKPMIEQGVTATDYEPYTGGEPSPNPDYPQNVNVITGENEVKIQNKNFFDKNDITNGYLNQDGTINTSSAENKTSGYIKVLPNTTYIRNDINGNVFYDKNKNVLGYVYTNKFTTPENCEYIRITVLTNNLNTFQIEKGSTATPYVEHKEQIFPLSLGSLELAKIGEYKDEIFQNTPNSKYYDSSLVADGWYKKKRIGKYTFTGNEEYAKSTAYSNEKYLCIYTNNSLIENILNDGNMLATRFSTIGYYVSILNQECIASKKQMHIRILASRLTGNTAQAFKNLLQEWYNDGKPLIVYYILSDPTNEQINDTTLISQLNAIKNAVSYAGQTNINQTNANRPFEISVTAKKQI